MSKIYRNYWTMMTSEDYDIMYRKGTSHRDIYKVQDTKDAGHMRHLADDGGFFPMRAALADSAPQHVPGAAPEMANLLEEWQCFVLHGTSRRYSEREMLEWTASVLAKAGL